MADNVTVKLLRQTTGFRTFTDALPAAERKAVNAAALASKTAMLKGLSQVVPSRRLRNVGKKGVKLGVSYKITGTTNPTARVRATGPWQLIENRTMPHPIVPRKRGGKMAVMTPAGPRASVHHPGTAGRHPWAKSVPAASVASRLVFQEEMHKTAKQHFKG